MHYKAVYNRAFSYDKLGRHDEALEDYTRALEMQPKNSTAYHNRGNTLEKMGRLEEAMAFLVYIICYERNACIQESGPVKDARVEGTSRLRCDATQK